MRRNTNRQIGAVGAALCLLTMTSIAMAAAVRHMNLDALTTNAETVFRGTVIGIEVGTVSAGGGELPTTTYSLRVEELFKGEATATKGGEQFMSVTMVGSIKDDAPRDDNLVRFNVFREIPRLERGSEYLLFTTPKSAAGLTVTVGLAQGCFDIMGGMALNRAGNQGLLMGTTYAGPQQGPIEYRELAEHIRSSLATQ